VAPHAPPSLDEPELDPDLEPELDPDFDPELDPEPPVKPSYDVMSEHPSNATAPQATRMPAFPHARAIVARA
jgi:hypothetical protein